MLNRYKSPHSLKGVNERLKGITKLTFFYLLKGSQLADKLK